MPFMIRRIIETLAVSVLCSLPFGLLYSYEILSPAREIEVIVSVTSFALFVLINVFFFIQYIFAVRRVHTYMYVNITAYVIYAVASYFAQVYLNPEMVSYLIMPLSVLKYAGFPEMIDMTSVHVIMMIIIILVPRYIWLFDREHFF